MDCLTDTAVQGNEELPILYIHRQSAYLLGRDRKVADVPLDHPSCSKQVTIQAHTRRVRPDPVPH